MPGYRREGKMRAKLRAAIFDGFNPASLDQILSDNDRLQPNIAIGPDFGTRVNSLIDVARREGWLIELCGMLATARAGNEAISSKIVAVQKWLIEGGSSNDPEVRNKAYSAAIQRVTQQAYFAPLHTYVTTYGYSKQLDFTPYSDELPRFYLAKWK